MNNYLFFSYREVLLGFIKNCHKIIYASLLFLILQFWPLLVHAQHTTEILDNSHYSYVFGEIRNFRIFLPPGHRENPEKRYPVIYYYHGWSQRYFGSIHDFKADEGNSNGGDNIANFVATHDVIVVKPDGYNRRLDEEYYLRPYNIGPVESYRQFPLYFPEIIKYIDEHYQTIPNREQRAITGLSMGGFMTFWISGKYPHLVSAAGNFCGSTEFVVGPKDFPVEYRHQDMFKNYKGVNVRLNYGDKDFIRDYHGDMNKIWTQVMDNYEYKVYPAAHSTCGLGEMFEFFMKTFENPTEKPKRWDHIDVYPSFDVWDYKVNSDRNVPGFTVLEDVDEQGFKCSVRTFLPDGELMSFVKLSVTTSPIYEKNQLYRICDINPLSGSFTEYFVKSNSNGQLKIEIDGGIHEIGISKKEENAANIKVASHRIKNMDWATSGKKVDISIKLLNKGYGIATKVSAKLYATKKSAVVLKNTIYFDSIQPLEIKELDVPFTFQVNSDTVEIERFRLVIQDENGYQWEHFIDVPIRKGVPKIKDFIIADGKEFAVAEAGDDTVSVFLGKGNGDGKANPGESVVILVRDSGRLFRTFLHTNDPYINPNGIHIRRSDNWGSYDHVGASAKYSVPVLSSECPDDHVANFFAEYWLPNYPEHIIKQGVVNVKVNGEDSTPPELQWIRILGDNTIMAKLYDGARIPSVKVKFYLKDEPDNSFNVELFNHKTPSNSSNGKRVFSNRIEEKGFGLYKVVVTATDIFGNIMEKEWPEIMVVH